MTDKNTLALIKYRIQRADETVEPWILRVKEFIDDIKHLSKK